MKSIISEEAFRAISEIDAAIEKNNTTVLIHAAGVAWGVFRVALRMDMLDVCWKLNAAISRANNTLLAKVSHNE